MSTLAPNAAEALVDRLAAAGLPLLPNDPAQKYPAGYNDWRTRTFTTEEIIHNYTRRRGLGLRTGDGIEAVDLDAKNWPGDKGELRVLFEDLVEQSAPGLLAQLVTQETPSGGRHYLYRCDITEPSRKLAQRPPTAAERAETPHAQALTIIETRGDGGQIQIAPSPGYHVLHGDLAAIPTITPEERAVLLDCARAFDQVPRAHAEPPRPQPGDERPGDRYNRNGGADEALALLERAGWAVARQCGATAYLTRPGGTRRHVHATFGAVAPGVFYPFSTNCAPFEPGTAYTPFAVLATLEHAGDYKAAARALADRYGLASRQPGAQRHAEAAAAEGAGEAERWWGAVLPVPRDEVLRCLANDEAGDAELFAKLYAGRYVYDRAAGAWYTFEAPVWRRLNGPPRPAVWGGLAACYLAVAAELQRELERADDATSKALTAQIGQLIGRAKQLRRLTRCNAVLGLASDPGMLSIAGDEWNRDAWVLAVANGVVDLCTGELRSGRPEDYLTHQAPTTWAGLDTPAPRWERFIAEVMSEEADRVAFLQRVLGYGLNGTTREHILVLLVGERGRNGKSVLLETIRNVLGPYATGVSHDVIIGQAGRRAAGSAQPHLMSLRGRRIVYTSETEDGAQISAAQVKQITGGDTITARDLFAHPVSFTPSHTIFLATNRRPHAPADDDALWERVKVLEFKARFVDDPVAPDERRRDPGLADALAAEAAGILAWLVRGHLAWRSDGLQTPASVQLARDAYRLGESLEPFLGACCVLADDGHAEAAALYEAYSAWCAGHGIRPRSNQWFWKQMAGRFERGRTGTGRSCYYGVQLRPASAKMPSEPSELSEQVVEPSEGIRMRKGATPSEGSEGTEGLFNSKGRKLPREAELLTMPSEPSEPSDPSTPSAPPAAARQVGGGLPPGFILVPHETRGVWLSCPISFLSDYYPDKASAIRAVQNWVARGCPEERDPPD